MVWVTRDEAAAAWRAWTSLSRGDGAAQRAQHDARPELRVHAGRGLAGHRVELVEQHRLALDEEVDARQAAAARDPECVDGKLAKALACRVGDPRGHLQLHPALGVLGLVVVPAGALEQDDLARLGGLRAVGVAQHRALDLQPRAVGLDDHARVVGERAVERRAQLALLRHADDAHRRAQPRGLDPAGKPDAVELGGLAAILLHQRVGDLRECRRPPSGP